MLFYTHRTHTHATHICLHICIYVCVLVHVYVYTHACMHVCACTYTHNYICIKEIFLVILERRGDFEECGFSILVINKTNEFYFLCTNE